MRNLLRYRLYCLLRSRQFYGLAALLVLISLILTRAYNGTGNPTFFLGALMIRPAREDETQAYMLLSRSLSACGELFLVPSVLCGILMCGDYTEQRLLPVVTTGYTRRSIHITEWVYLVVLHVSILLTVRFLHVLAWMPQYRLVIAWTGWRWILSLIFVRGTLSMGNLAVFILLAAFARRREPVLILGFLGMALETLQNEWFGLWAFPSGGVRLCFGWGSPKMAWCYLLECMLLVGLSLCLPLLLPSKIKL